MVRAREILSPISSSFRFTGLIIFALEPAVSSVLGHFSALLVPASRALWTVKSYLFDIETRVTYARFSAASDAACIRASARAAAFVALSAIILSDNSAQRSCRSVRGTSRVHRWNVSSPRSNAIIWVCCTRGSFIFNFAGFNPSSIVSFFRLSTCNLKMSSATLEYSCDRELTSSRKLNLFKTDL